MRRVFLPRVFLLAIVVCAASCLWLDASAVAETECANAANPVACENALPGDPQSDWQVEGIGDPTIQGYATSMSVNVGEAVNFKIKTPASSYHIDILRLGYYGGLGARKIASNTPAVGETPPDPAGMPATRDHRADRLWQLERLGVVDGPEKRCLGRLHRAPGAQRHRRLEPDPVRGAKRLQPLGSPAADLRRDVGGLQRLRR